MPCASTHSRRIQKLPEQSSASSNIDKEECPGMLEDEAVSGGGPAPVSSAAHALLRSDELKPSPLEEEVVNLFDQLQDRLLRYLLSLGLSASDGEEVIQETFLALFLHLQRGKPRHNLRAWIFQVAHNLALKQRNTALRNRQSLVEYGGVSAENAFVDRTPNPEDQFAWNERRRRLFGVWQALPEQDRRCLVLRAEGLTYREITQILDMSLGAVSLSVGRSLARFARAEER
jgi:RNA polymerase sigma-70 factor, ECF subfamily